MKHYVKNLYSFEATSPVPSFMGQREQFTCPHCRVIVVIPVPTTGIDFELIANDYKKLCNEMWKDFNDILAEEGMDTICRRKVEELLKRIKSNFGK